MLLEEPADRTGLEVAEPLEPLGRQFVPDDIPQLIAQPCRRRSDEPPLRGAQVVAGQAGAQGSSEQTLVAPQADLDVVGEAEHALDQYVIHERHPDLEGVCHGEAVAQCENIVR